MFAKRQEKADDEELLIFEPTHMRSKPPTCGLCCNTKCGSYFITALHMSMGLLLMLTAFCSDPVQMYQLADVDPSNRKAVAMAYMTRRESIFLWGLLITTISMLSFRGIKNENHKLLNPTIFLQYVQMFFLIIQTAFTIMCWPEISKILRQHLLTLADRLDVEIYSDDSGIDAESMTEWSNFEYVIRSDDGWAAMSPKILYMITLFHSVQIILTAWMTWTVTYHKRWIQHKFNGSATRNAGYPSVSGVIIKTDTVRK